jgi:hypothetical protein
LFVGAVEEVPVEIRKGERTHSFKIVTTVGSSFCYYKSEETARKAHGALYGMLKSANPNIYPHRMELLDAARVVSIGDVVALKNPKGDLTHALIVSVETTDPRNAKVWLKYKSEDNARKARRALYAVVSAATGGEKAPEQATDSSVAETPAPQPVAVGESAPDLPF